MVVQQQLRLSIEESHSANELVGSLTKVLFPTLRHTQFINIIDRKHVFFDFGVKLPVIICG